jgi:hypothetical protein
MLNKSMRSIRSSEDMNPIKVPNFDFPSIVIEGRGAAKKSHLS